MDAEAGELCVTNEGRHVGNAADAEGYTASDPRPQDAGCTQRRDPDAEGITAFERSERGVAYEQRRGIDARRAQFQLAVAAAVRRERNAPLSPQGSVDNSSSRKRRCRNVCDPCHNSTFVDVSLPAPDAHPIPTAARAAVRQPGAHVPGTYYGDEIREEITQAYDKDTQPTNGMVESNEGSQAVHALVVENMHKSSRLSTCARN